MFQHIVKSLIEGLENGTITLGNPMLKDEIRRQILVATKAKSEPVRNVLKVVLGDIELQEARNNAILDDSQISEIIRKTLQGVEEMLLYKPADAGLALEKETLEALLPKQLDKSAIKVALADKDLKNAKSDGIATGIAMKFFKEANLLVDGTDVAAVVKELRA